MKTFFNARIVHSLQTDGELNFISGRFLVIVVINWLPHTLQGTTQVILWVDCFWTSFSSVEHRGTIWSIPAARSFRIPINRVLLIRTRRFPRARVLPEEDQGFVFGSASKASKQFESRHELCPLAHLFTSFRVPLIISMQARALWFKRSSELVCVLNP